MKPITIISNENGEGREVNPNPRNNQQWSGFEENNKLPVFDAKNEKVVNWQGEAELIYQYQPAYDEKWYDCSNEAFYNAIKKNDKIPTRQIYRTIEPKLKEEGKRNSNTELIKDFNYGTYQNELTTGIAKNTVKIHLRKQIELLQFIIGYSRTDIINLIGDLELQRSELL